MRRILAAAAICLSSLTSVRAEGTAGDFDYYVLSLSWSPNWCALEGSDRGSPQCDIGQEFGWVLHGLWPQYERGWPDYCSTSEPQPTERQTRLMATIMGSSGSAWHQWRKHGVCSGLSATDYFATAVTAYNKVTRPDVFLRLEQEITLPASVVEDAFVAENQGLRPDMITITCRAGAIQEARVCMTRDLEFRTCGQDVIRDCSLDDASLLPVR